MSQAGYKKSSLLRVPSKIAFGKINSCLKYLLKSNKKAAPKSAHYASWGNFFFSWSPPLYYANEKVLKYTICLLVEKKYIIHNAAALKVPMGEKGQDFGNMCLLPFNKS